MSIASSFFLKVLLVSLEKRRSSALSRLFVEEVVSVAGVLFAFGDVYVGELSEKVTRVLVGVAIFDVFPRGNFSDDVFKLGFM